jgi:homoserine acetyltransferase
MSQTALDFRGRDALLAVVERAYAQPDGEGLTRTLRDGLCELIKSKAVSLPDCVFEPVEGHYARRFVRNFDPNCYLYLSRSMDWFDLAEYAGGDIEAGLASIRVDKSLSMGVHTDILFPLQQQQQVAEGLAAGGAQTEFVDLPSPQGHDAFLVDIERFGPVIAGFLGRL